MPAAGFSYPDEIAPTETPFGLVDVKPPTFPDRIVSIVDHGAVPGGEVMNTEAINGAIAACASAGGGRVLVPEGAWLCGPIDLQSNVDLHLLEGAEIRFSQVFDDYLPPAEIQGAVRYISYHPLVYAKGCTNMAITGKGTLNGRGQIWWPWKHRVPPLGPQKMYAFNENNTPLEERVLATPEDGSRPNLVHLLECRNVFVEGITVKDSPSWTVHFAHCENVIARGVVVIGKGPNNDGINPNGCKNVLIEHCLLDTGDDCVTIKSGKGEQARLHGPACENVLVRHCRGIGGHNIVAIGSETSGSVRNICVHDCQSDHTGRGLHIKTRRGRGGAVENIWFQNVTIGKVYNEGIRISLRYDGEPAERAVNFEERHANSPYIPYVRNIHIENLGCGHASRAALVEGIPDRAIQNLTIENAVINADSGMSLENVDGVTLKNVTVVVKEGPRYALRYADNVTIG